MEVDFTRLNEEVAKVRLVAGANVTLGVEAAIEELVAEADEESEYNELVTSGLKDSVTKLRAQLDSIGDAPKDANGKTWTGCEAGFVDSMDFVWPMSGLRVGHHGWECVSEDVSFDATRVRHLTEVEEEVFAGTRWPITSHALREISKVWKEGVMGV